jgi:hypothetical protein
MMPKDFFCSSTGFDFPLLRKRVQGAKMSKHSLRVAATFGVSGIVDFPFGRFRQPP